MILIISHLGFQYRIFVLIIPIPGHCLPFIFHLLAYKMANITYQTLLILFSLFGMPLYRNYNEKDEYSLVKGTSSILVLIEIRVQMTFADMSTDLL